MGVALWVGVPLGVGVELGVKLTWLVKAKIATAVRVCERALLAFKVPWSANARAVSVAAAMAVLAVAVICFDGPTTTL